MMDSESANLFAARGLSDRTVASSRLLKLTALQPASVNEIEYLARSYRRGNPENSRF